LLSCFTGPEFAIATFGETLTPTEVAFAFWSIEFDAFCDWSIDWDRSPQPPLLPPWLWRASFRSVLLCVERFLFAAAAPEDALLDCSTPPPHLQSPSLFSMATFGEALTATDFASAFCEIEFDASWLCRTDCDFGDCLLALQQWLALSSARAPDCDCPAVLLSVFPCCESFLLTATPSEDASLDWSTEPLLAIATFGETFTAADCAVAVWSIEFVALCDW
jgi:hypothetical protein